MRRKEPRLRVGAKPNWLVICVVCVAGAWGSPVHGQGEDGSDEDWLAIRSQLDAGGYAEAERLARRALQTLEERGEGETLRAADVLDLLLEAFWRQAKGRTPESEELADRAIRLEESILGTEHPRLARTLLWRSRLNRQRAQDDRARQDLDRAMRIKEAAGEEDADLAAVLSSLGFLLSNEGLRQDARLYFERAIGILEGQASPDRLEIASALNGLGSIAWRWGDYATARVHWEEALQIREEVLPEGHPLIAGLLNNLGLLYMETGNYLSARDLLERALAIRVQKLPANHYLITSPLIALASLDRKVGRIDSAQAKYERARTLLERYHPKNPSLPVVLHNLGLLQAELGHPDEAFRLYQRAQDLWLQSVGAEHHSMARVLHSKAKLYFQLGQMDSARIDFARALAIRRQTLGEDHPLCAESLVGLAAVQAATGAAAAALESSLEAETIARAHLQLTVRGLVEREALQYTKVGTRMLDLAVSIVANATPAREEDVWKVWDATVNSRAVILEEITRRRRWVSASVDPATQALSRETARARERLAALVLRGPQGNEQEEYRALLDEARVEKETKERELASLSSTVAESPRDDTSLAAIVESLPETAALVAYVLFRDPYLDTKTALSDDPMRLTRPRGRDELICLAAFVLEPRQRKPRLFHLGPWQRVDSLLVGWSKAIATEAGAASYPPERIEALQQKWGRALRRVVLDPIDAAVAGAGRIFIVPEASLNRLSFCALPTDDGQYFVERSLRFHYLTAERDLLPRDAPTGEGLLVMGAPDFDSATPTKLALRSGNVSSGQQRTLPCPELEALRFSSLSMTTAEIEDVLEIWEKARMARNAGVDASSETVHTGAAATERTFKQEAPRRRFVHLATHGFFLGTECTSRAESTLRGFQVTRPHADAFPDLNIRADPIFLSGVAFSGANRRDGGSMDTEDGILTSAEVASLDLTLVECIVLSACETGVGAEHVGEGVLGLRRSFQAAGARTLVMSLWKVADAPTREWMAALYRARFIEGLSTMDAVHEATASLLRQRRDRGEGTDPFYWAPFVSAGDWH